MFQEISLWKAGFEDGGQESSVLSILSSLLYLVMSCRRHHHSRPGSSTPWGQELFWRRVFRHVQAGLSQGRLDFAQMFPDQTVLAAVHQHFNLGLARGRRRRTQGLPARVSVGWRNRNIKIRLKLEW